MKTDFNLIGTLGIPDFLVFFFCLALLITTGYLFRRSKNTAKGYFMADRDLPWWSVAGSIYGTNVSLSQIIGMLGIGYSIGFAQSHYELLAIPAILMLCHVFIPVYRKKEVFTLSAFLGERYDENARLLYTIIILLVILILLIGGLYIGSRQLGLLFSGVSFQPGYFQGIVFIAVVSSLLVFYGGMQAVVVSENIITILMVFAVITVGLSTLWQPEIGGFIGLLDLDASGRGMGKMKLYLPSNHPDLPWTGVFSGLLILHGFFWTTNQFEVQRVLAARSDRDAQLGAIAAGFLKLTIPFFSISAGVASAYIFRDRYGLDLIKPDDAFMYLLGEVVPGGYGLLGLILAGFIGAIFSSIYSMLNSFSTVAAIDVYKRYVNGNASDEKLVFVGRISVLVACLIAVIMAWWSFNPDSEGNFFLVLSKNTSYLKPGIVSAFFLGVLWKRTHPQSGVVAIIAAPVLSFAVEIVYDNWLNDFSICQSLFGSRLNFLHRVFFVFIFCMIIQILISLFWNRVDSSKREWGVEQRFKFDRVFIFLILQIMWLIIIYGFGLGSKLLSFPVAVIGFFVLWDFKKPRSVVNFWSALLATVMLWSLYFFV